MNHPRFFPVFLLLILALIWGSSFILMKLGLEGLNPYQLAAVRLSTASLCLSPFLIRFFRHVRKEDWKFLFISGLIGNGIPAYLFATSETVISSAQAGILNSLSPLFTLIASFVLFRATFPAAKLIGVLIGFSGALLILTSGEADISFGKDFQYSLLVVIATVCYGISATILKYRLNHANPIMVSAFSISFVGLPSLILLFTMIGYPTEGEHVNSALLFTMLLGAMGTALALVLFNRLLKMTDVVYASSVTYLMPVVALGWGFYFHEGIQMMQVVGLGLIIGGVYLMNRKFR